MGLGGCIGKLLYVDLLKDTVGVVGAGLLLGTVFVLTLAFIFSRDIGTELEKVLMWLHARRVQRAQNAAERAEQQKKEKEAKEKVTAAKAAAAALDAAGDDEEAARHSEDQGGPRSRGGPLPLQNPGARGTREACKHVETAR